MGKRAHDQCARRQGQWLIEPEGGAAVTRARSDVPLYQRAGVHSTKESEPGAYTVSPRMTLHALWPPILAYAATIAVILAGVALTLRAEWGALACGVSAFVAVTWIAISFLPIGVGEI